MLPPNCTYILARSAASATTSGRCAHFSVRAFGVLLFDVSVKRRVAQISLRAVTTFEVTTLDIILAAALALARPIIVLIVVILLVWHIVLPVIALRASPSHVLHG